MVQAVKVFLAPEEIEPLNLTDIETENDTPVDNFFTDELRRLLVEVLYGSWAKKIYPRKFLAGADIGVFYAEGQPPLVPDVFLSLDVEIDRDFYDKRNRSYFIWVVGKPPDVAIEIVSNRKGNELTSKRSLYAEIGIDYYVAFDPTQQLSTELLQVFELRGGVYALLEPIEISEQLSMVWLEQIGLGLRLWEGIYEGKQDRWLRWCDREGKVLPTGTEIADRLAAKLRAMGIDPDLD